MKGDITLDKLAEAWNEFLKEFPDSTDMPLHISDRINFKSIVNHIDERIDFKNIINAAQRLVMTKQLRELRPDKYR